METQTLNPVEAAQNRVDELLNSMVDGARVTAKQLVEARAEVEIAEARQEADRKREQREIEAKRLETIQEFQQQLSDTGANLEDIANLRSQLAQVLDSYLSLAAKHNATLNDILDEIHNQGLQTDSRLGSVSGYEVSGSQVSGKLRIGEVETSFVVAPHKDILLMVDEEIREHFPRGTVSSFSAELRALIARS